jgi:hypothetical protein
MMARPMSLAILMLCTFSLRAFADPVSPKQAREMAKRALPFLFENEDRDIKSAAAGKACVSCHWGAQAIRSINQAQQSGLLDDKDAKRFDDMLKKLSTRLLAYQLNAKSFDVLKTAGVPADTMTAAKKINQTFTDQKKLKAELAKVLPADLLAQHEAKLMETAANPNHYDDPGELIAATMLLAGAPAKTSKPTEITNGLVERILLLQQPNGSFKDGGQPMFPGLEPNERLECNARLAVLALNSVEPKSEALLKARDRALEFLKTIKPGKSTDSLLLQLMFAHRAGEAEQVAKLTKELLSQQRADGGWSTWNWLKDKTESDARATGQVLYMLGALGRKHDDPSVQRAWEYLLKNQEDDGSWYMTNSKDKAIRIWSYWGTSWAFMGILNTLPK